jgi:murein L,D-transpeptidase YafK
VLVTKAEDLESMLIRYPRVAEAAARTDTLLKELCNLHQLSFPPQQLLIRAFKEEKELELWASDGGAYHLLKIYPICMLPGKPGPKIRQGDKQVPEGFYVVDTLNPNSDFHLSFRINYPNQADLIRSKDEKDPGGDIYIHGDCISAGCLPVGDDAIEEIFWLLAKHQSGYPKNNIHVHIFPGRMEDDKWIQREGLWSDFWQQLKSIHDYFNENNILPTITVTQTGEYIMSTE